MKKNQSAVLAYLQSGLAHQELLLQRYRSFYLAVQAVFLAVGLTVFGTALSGQRDAIATAAFYVGTLVLGAGATVTLADGPVYYNTLIDHGATIIPNGSGSLTRVASTGAIPTASTWGLIAMLLLLLVAGTFVFTASRIPTPARSRV